MARAIKVLIVDDARVIRSYLRQCIVNLRPDIIVGEASNGIEAVAKFKELNPDLTLLDINMPQVSGTEALAQIISLDPSATVVMLSAQDSTSVVEDCLERGASNFLLKNMAKPNLMSELTSLLDEATGAR